MRYGAPTPRSICLRLVRPFFRLGKVAFLFFNPTVSCLNRKILIAGNCPMSFRKYVMRPAHNARHSPISCLESLAGESKQIFVGRIGDEPIFLKQHRKGSSHASGRRGNSSAARRRALILECGRSHKGPWSTPEFDSTGSSKLFVSRAKRMLSPSSRSTTRVECLRLTFPIPALRLRVILGN